MTAFTVPWTHGQLISMLRAAERWRRRIVHDLGFAQRRKARAAGRWIRWRRAAATGGDGVPLPNGGMMMSP
jgi:hypothetical protein